LKETDETNVLTWSFLEWVEWSEFSHHHTTTASIMRQRREEDYYFHPSPSHHRKLLTPTDGKIRPQARSLVYPGEKFSIEVPVVGWMRE
jgi:hypothetical protein